MTRGAGRVAMNLARWAVEGQAREHVNRSKGTPA